MAEQPSPRARLEAMMAAGGKGDKRAARDFLMQALHDGAHAVDAVERTVELRQSAWPEVARHMEATYGKLLVLEGGNVKWPEQLRVQTSPPKELAALKLDDASWRVLVERWVNEWREAKMRVVALPPPPDPGVGIDLIAAARAAREAADRAAALTTGALARTTGAVPPPPDTGAGAVPSPDRGPLPPPEKEPTFDEVKVVMDQFLADAPIELKEDGTLMVGEFTEDEVLADPDLASMPEFIRKRSPRLTEALWRTFLRQWLQETKRKFTGDAATAGSDEATARAEAERVQREAEAARLAAEVAARAATTARTPGALPSGSVSGALGARAISAGPAISPEPSVVVEPPLPEAPPAAAPVAPAPEARPRVPEPPPLPPVNIDDLRRRALAMKKEINRLILDLQAKTRRQRGMTEGSAEYDNLGSDINAVETSLEQARRDHHVLLGDLADARGVVLDAVEREIEAAAPTPAEVPPPAPEGTPPAPPELAEQMVGLGERWLRTGLLLPKMAAGAVLTVSGYRLTKTAFDAYGETKFAEKMPETVSGLARELHNAHSRGATASEAESESARSSFQEKARELSQYIEKLVTNGRMKPEDTQAAFEKIDQALRRHLATTEAARNAFGQEVSRILQDYYKAKTTRADVLKEAGDFALMAGGISLRLAYRSLKGLAEQYEKVKQEQEARRAAGASIDEHSPLWKQTLTRTWQEWRQHASRSGEHLASLLTMEQQRKGEYLQREMSFAKSVGAGLVVGGFAYGSAMEAVHAHGADFGFKALQDSVAKQGGGFTGWQHALGENMARSAYQYSVGLFQNQPPLTERGTVRERVAKETAPSAPESHSPISPEVEQKFFTANPAWQRFENEYPGQVDVQGHADGHVSVTVNIGERDIRYSEHAVDKAVTMTVPLPKGGVLDTLHGGHLQNVEGNLNHWLRHEDLLWKGADGEPLRMSHHELDGIARMSPDGRQLEIDDLEKFMEKVNNTLLPHALGKDPAHLQGAIGSLGNQSDARVQHDWDIKTGQPGAVKVQFDHGVIHAAQAGQFNFMVKDSDLGQYVDASTVHINKAEVTGNNNGAFHVGDQKVLVDHGKVRDIVMLREGREYHYDLMAMGYGLIDMADAYSGYALARELGRSARRAEGIFATTETGTVEAGATSSTTAASTPEGRSVVIPGQFERLIKTPVDRGGLLGRDGYIHFGEVRFKPEWLDRIDRESGEAFARDPLGVGHVPWYLKRSQEARALQLLAQVIQAHPDSGTVGDFIVRHKNELEGWMRAVGTASPEAPRNSI